MPAERCQNQISTAPIDHHPFHNTINISHETLGGGTYIFATAPGPPWILASGAPQHGIRTKNLSGQAREQPPISSKTLS